MWALLKFVTIGLTTRKTHFSPKSSLVYFRNSKLEEEQTFPEPAKVFA